MWIGILTYIEEKNGIPGLHVDFIKKDRTAQLNGSFMRQRLPGMLKERKHHAGDALLLDVAALVGRSSGFVKRCDLTGVILLFTEIVKKVLFEHRGGA